MSAVGCNLDLYVGRLRQVAWESRRGFKLDSEACGLVSVITATRGYHRFGHAMPLQAQPLVTYVPLRCFTARYFPYPTLSNHA
jgi:hypothetical protein